MYLVEMENDLRDINDALLVLDNCQARLLYAEARLDGEPTPVDAVMGEMLGCEGIADIAAAAWRGIKAMLKKIYDFFASIVGAIGGLFGRRSRAEGTFNRAVRAIDRDKLDADIKKNTVTAYRDVGMAADPKLQPPQPAAPLLVAAKQGELTAKKIEDKLKTLPSPTDVDGGKNAPAPLATAEMEKNRKDVDDRLKASMQAYAEEVMSDCYGYEGPGLKPFMELDVTRHDRPCVESRYLKFWDLDNTDNVTKLHCVVVTRRKDDPTWVVSTGTITIDDSKTIEKAKKHYGIKIPAKVDAKQLIEILEKSGEFTAGLDPKELKSANNSVRGVIDQFERLRENAMAKVKAGAIAQVHFDQIVREIDLTVKNLATALSVGAKDSARASRMYLRSTIIAMERVTKLIEDRK